jgi:predicted RNase H-like nuclease (RuvC/YqgF family)
MRSQITCLNSHVIIIITAALTAFLLMPTASPAQDEKDREIARLKALVEAQSVQVDRLLNEVKALSELVKERDTKIINLETRIKALITETVRNEAELRKSRPTNEEIANRVNQALPNPPAVHVSGKIEKLDGDLVQINRGTTHGVAKGNTLEVFRLEPEPKYLGMIRIVEATSGNSVGRIVAPEKARRTELMIGDLVTSRIQATETKK